MLGVPQATAATSISLANQSLDEEKLQRKAEAMRRMMVEAEARRRKGGRRNAEISFFPALKYGGHSVPRTPAMASEYEYSAWSTTNDKFHVIHKYYNYLQCYQL